MYKWLNADDEIPKCSNCDNQDTDEEACIERCGPSHGWNLYARYVRTEEEE